MFDDGGFKPLGKCPICYKSRNKNMRSFQDCCVEQNSKHKVVKFLTVLTMGSFDLRRKTIRVERITDVNGAAAETQKSFLFLMLCIN